MSNVKIFPSLPFRTPMHININTSACRPSTNHNGDRWPITSRANCQMFFFIQSSRDINFCFRVTWHKYFLRVRVVYIYILYWIVNRRVESRKNRCLCVFSETSAAGSGFWEKHALLSAHYAEHFVCEVVSRVGNTSKATRDLNVPFSRNEAFQAHCWALL